MHVRTYVGKYTRVHTYIRTFICSGRFDELGRESHPAALEASCISNVRPLKSAGIEVATPNTNSCRSYRFEATTTHEKDVAFPLAHPLNHSLTHLLTHSINHSLTHSLTHSLANPDSASGPESIPSTPRFQTFQSVRLGDSEYLNFFDSIAVDMHACARDVQRTHTLTSTRIRTYECIGRR